MTELITCRYIHQRGKLKGTRCEVCPYKNQVFCAAHKRSNQVDRDKKKDENNKNLKDDDVFTSSKPQKTIKEPILKSSVWHITINSNRSLDSLNKKEKMEFKNINEYLFEKQGIMDFITDAKKAGHDNIKEVTSEVYFEASSGSGNGRIHSHAYLKIIHSGLLSLQANDLRSFLKRVLGYSCHLDCPVSSDSEFAWNQYIKKNQNKIDL